MTTREDGFDEDANIALRRVPSPDDGEAEALLAVSLFEHDGVEGQVEGLGSSGEG